MKTSILKLTFMLLFAVAVKNAAAQEAWKSVVVSPLIGDTLDAKERDTYVLFGANKGFQWAVFLLGPDSVVRARVAYLRDQVAGFDTLDTGFRLAALRYRLEKTYELFLSESMAKGKTKVEVRLQGGKVLAGELLSVRDSSIVLSTSASMPGSRAVGDWKFVSAHSFRDIENIMMPSSGNSGMVLGMVIGACTGAALVAATAGSSKKESLSPNIPAWPGGAIIGGLLGLGIGSAASKDGAMFSPRDYASLKSHARFNKVEPEYLREIR